MYLLVSNVKGMLSNNVFLQYDFNLFSHNASVLSNGYNEEEMKMVKETRKIWNDKDVRITATCIRVPVMRAHAESVNLQFEKPLDEVLPIFPWLVDLPLEKFQMASCTTGISKGL
ncbi:hypothetical protein K1719_005115 [Acacia pycnantha]|nr:hypothetical protein K1719_005115 [Acacia pycnantha]